MAMTFLMGGDGTTFSMAALADVMIGGAGDDVLLC
jgi:hypothetical protein